jgi:hypothetical protein
MSKDKKESQERTMKIVADAKRLVDEVRQAVATNEKFFAERNADRMQLETKLRNMGVLGGQQKVQGEINNAVLEIKEAAERAELQRQFEQPSQRRSKRIRNLI